MNHRHSLITVLAFLIATGTHAELPPDSPVLKRLGELKSAFAAAVQNDASAAHELAVKDLNGKYAAALERAITSQTQAGKLDEALAVRAEKQLIDGQKALPADDADIAETLKPLRTTYRNTLAKLEADRDKRLAPLRAKYDQALAAYFAELTKAGDLDGALAVKAVRDALPSSQVPLAPKTTGPAPASRTAAPAATKAKAAKYDPAAAAKIIDWLFTCKGVAVVSTDGGKTTKEAKVTEDLPKGRFELIRIFHGHSSQTVPEEPFPWASLEGVPTLLELRLRQKQIVTAADVAHLAALSELTFLHLPSARIEDTAFDAFPLNPKVRHLIIYGTTFASEGSMAKLTASYPNLENLDINRCLPVTPELVRVGASLKKLTRFVTSGVVTAEVAKAIGAMPSLTEWVHTIGRVDDAMPPGVLASSLKNLTRLALGDLPNAKVLLPDIIRMEQLWHLGIENGEIEAPEVAMLSKLRIGSLALADNKTLGDDALAEIAKMRTVKWLDLRGTTAITDAGLLHLAKMKQLEQVQLGPSRITDTGVAALKKALPNCRVQH